MKFLSSSAISEVPTCYHQNDKVLPIYQRTINQNQLATYRGHLLTEEDQQQKEQILELMTRREVTLRNEEQLKDISLYLHELYEDGLFKFEGLKLIITSKGEPFLRNVCTALDLHFRRNSPTTPTFSKAL